MNKKKIISSLALAGVLSASVLGINAATDEYLKPVGIYKKLVDNEVVVPYILSNEDITSIKPVKVSDLVAEFENVELVNGESATDTTKALRTGDTFRANGMDYTIVVYGDVNKDTKLAASDVLLMKNIVIQIATGNVTADKFQVEAADVVNEGKVMASDALALQNYLLGKTHELVNPLPPEEDETAPVITIDGYEDGGTVYVNANNKESFEVPTATAFDDYDGEVEVVVDDTEVEVNEDGTYTVTYTATDKSGNEATATLTVVVDTVKPEVTGVESGKSYKSSVDEPVKAEFVEGTATLQKGEEEATDYESGTNILDEGRYTLTVTDEAGNEETVEFVVDNTEPEIKGLPESGKVYVKDEADSVGKLPDVTAEDNFSTALVVGEDASEVNYDVDGEYTITYTVTDEAGNEATAELTVVVDKVEPTINGITDEKIYVQNEEDAQGKLPTVTVEDNHSTGLEATMDDSKVVYEEDGEYTVTYTATDDAGNVTTKELTVVVDTTAPVITFTEEVEGPIYINPDDEEFTVPTATAMDGEESVAVVVTGDNFDRSTPGEYTVTYTATDKAGNVKTETVTVVVDNNGPVLKEVVESEEIVLPAERTDYVKADSTEYELPVVKAYDNVDGDSIVIPTIEKKNGEAYDPAEKVDTSAEAEYKLTYSKTDTNGTTTTFVLTLIVDGTFNTPDVGYNTQDPAKEVTVTITADEAMQPLEEEGWTLSEDGKTLTKVYKENVTKKQMTVKDLAGNEQTVEINISNIDNEVTLKDPAVTYSPELTTPTNEEVTVKIEAEEALGEKARGDGLDTIYNEELLEQGWTLGADGKSISKVFEENTDGKVTVLVKDKLGNEKEVEIEVTNIDKEPPQELRVEFNPSELTNQKVKATIVANEPLDTSVTGTLVTEIETAWALDPEDNTKAVATFKANGEDTVTIKDLAGNETKVTVKVVNIDTDVPTLTVKYYINETEDEISNSVKTNKDIKVVVESDEELADLSEDLTEKGWNLSEDRMYLSKVFTANDQENVTVYDLATNEATTTVTISNIDKDAPVVTMNGEELSGEVTGKSYKSTTSSALKATFTEGVATLEKVENGEGKGAAVYTSGDEIGKDEESGHYILIVTDTAGNVTKIEFDVDNKAPEFTDKEVDKLPDVTLKKDDEFDLSAVNVTDNVDNEEQLTVKIVELKFKPINSGETIIPESEIEGYVIDTTGEKDGTYTVKYKVTDRAGNETEISRTIKVDGTPATYSINYDEDEKVVQNVTVTITFNEDMKEEEELKADGWTKVSEQPDNPLEEKWSKLYDHNAIETLEFHDLAGNVTKVEVEIANIDGSAPGYQVTYSPDESEGPTNRNVIITITVTEEIEDLYSAGKELQSKGWTLNRPTGEEGNDHWTLTKTVASNETDKIKIKDLAGNTVDVDYSVTWIDTDNPNIEGSVSYNPEMTELTNDGVTVTITVSEEIQPLVGWDLAPVGDGKWTLTKKYEANTEGAETITFVDLAGNEGTAQVTITNIDKEAPVVTGIEKNGSYQNATINFKDANEDEPEPKTTSSASLTCDNPTYTQEVFTSGTKVGPEDGEKGTNSEKDGTYTLVVKDSLGNEDTYIFTIDNVAPEIKVNGEETEDETHYEKVSPTFSDGVGLLKKEVDAEGTGDYTEESTNPYTSGTEISEAGKYTLTVKDEAGNIATFVFYVDAEGPVIETPKDGETYNEDITVKVTGVDTEKVTVELRHKDGDVIESYTDIKKQIKIGTDQSDGETYLEDGEYTLTVTDEWERSTTSNFTIDTLAPEVRINGNLVTKSDNDLYYQTAIVSLADDCETKTFYSDWDESSSITVNQEEDGNYIFGPDAQSGDAQSDSKYSIVVEDEWGNKATIKFTIDNQEPTVSGIENKTYNYADTHPSDEQYPTPTSSDQDIASTVLVKDSKPVSEYILGSAIKDDGAYTLTVTDKAGNVTEYKFTIDTKVDLKENVSYGKASSEVLVRVSSNEKLDTETVPEKWTMASDAMSVFRFYTEQPGEDESITLKDLAGNEKQVTIEKDNIIIIEKDETAPQIDGEISYSTNSQPSIVVTTPVKESVKVKIQFTEDIKEVNVEGWKLTKKDSANDGKCTLEKTFDKDGIDELTIVDLAGNPIADDETKGIKDGILTIKISNIYDKVPTITPALTQESYEIELNDSSVYVSAEQIKDVTAVDCKGENIENVNITIKAEIKGLDINLNYTLENGKGLPVDKDATYTITYTATDVAGNVATVTRTIIVGDGYTAE